MKLTNRGPKRFSNPTVLRDDAPFFGSTVKVWDDAITGNMAQTLAKIKLLVEGDGPKRDISTASTSDVASFVSKSLANKKT